MHTQYIGIDNLTGKEFEIYLLNIFKSLGYKSHLTSSTGDYGADLVLTKDKQTIIVQAKRYSSTVGIKAVQEIIAAKNYYGADKCIVATNNYFSKNAYNLANCNNVDLIDRNGLIKLEGIISKRNKHRKMHSFIKKFISFLRPHHKQLENNHIGASSQESVGYNIDLNVIPDHDELLPQAIKLVIDSQYASISFLQRKLRVGYNRAAELINELEKIKVITPNDKNSIYRQEHKVILKNLKQADNQKK